MLGGVTGAARGGAPLPLQQLETSSSCQTNVLLLSFKAYAAKNHNPMYDRQNLNYPVSVPKYKVKPTAGNPIHKSQSIYPSSTYKVKPTAGNHIMIFTKESKAARNHILIFIKESKAPTSPQLAMDATWPKLI